MGFSSQVKAAALLALVGVREAARRGARLGTDPASCVPICKIQEFVTSWVSNELA